MDNSANIQNEPTSDEKLLAMLAHLSIFLGGIILPIILWATQKDKSKFVKFHSLQAIFYHIAYIIIFIFYIIFMAVLLIISGIGFAGYADSVRSSEMPAMLIVIMIILYAGIFILAFAGIGYAIWLAVKAYQGRLVKIPVIGKLVYKNVYGENQHSNIS